MTRHAEYAVSGDAAARRILGPNQLDRLGEALLALTGEVWILTDRLAVLEAVLAGHGINATEAIDRFVPSPDMEKTLDAKRDKLIATVLAALAAQDPPATS
jgi:hypothetical protein